jgi:hypothetical protein
MAVDTRGDLREPNFVQTYGPSVAFGSNFDLYTATYSVRPEKTEETVGSAKLDYVKDLRLRELPIQFKSGLNWRNQNRWGGLRGNGSAYRYAGPDGVSGLNAATRVNDDNIRQFVSPKPNTPVEIRGHHPWPALDLIDIQAVNRAFIANPGWFPQTGRATQDQSEITEDVYAGYGQARVQFGRSSLFSEPSFPTRFPTWSRGAGELFNRHGAAAADGDVPGDQRELRRRRHGDSQPE